MSTISFPARLIDVLFSVLLINYLKKPKHRQQYFHQNIITQITQLDHAVKRIAISIPFNVIITVLNAWRFLQTELETF